MVLRQGMVSHDEYGVNKGMVSYGKYGVKVECGFVWYVWCQEMV